MGDKKIATSKDSSDRHDNRWLYLIGLGAVLLAMLTVVIISALNLTRQQEESDVSTTHTSMTIYEAEQQKDYEAAAEGYSALSEQLEGEDKARFLESAAQKYYKAGLYSDALSAYLAAQDAFTELDMNSDVLRLQSGIENAEMRLTGEAISDE